MKRFGRSACAWMRLAAAMRACRCRRRATATLPATPSRRRRRSRREPGWNRSAARRKSSSASSKNSASPDLPRRAAFADAGVVGVAGADRLVEDRRVGRQAGDRQLVDVARQRAVVEHLARDVVEPKALAEIVKSLGRFHGVLPRSRDSRHVQQPRAIFNHRLELRVSSASSTSYRHRAGTRPPGQHGDSLRLRIVPSGAPVTMAAAAAGPQLPHSYGRPAPMQLENRLDHSPSRFHSVVAGEQAASPRMASPSRRS